MLQKYRFSCGRPSYPSLYIRVAIAVHMYMLVSWVLASRVAGGYPSLFNALLLIFLHGSMVKSTSSMQNELSKVYTNSAQ
jgi:hypothetical protein